MLDEYDHKMDPDEVLRKLASFSLDDPDAGTKLIDYLDTDRVRWSRPDIYAHFGAETIEDRSKVEALLDALKASGKLKEECGLLSRLHLDEARIKKQASLGPKIESGQAVIPSVSESRPPPRRQRKVGRRLGDEMKQWLAKLVVFMRQHESPVTYGELKAQALKLGCTSRRISHLINLLRDKYLKETAAGSRIYVLDPKKLLS